MSKTQAKGRLETKKTDTAKKYPRRESNNPNGRPVEWTPEKIEALADKLIQWSKSHTACYLESFCKQNDTYPQKLTELSGQNTMFSEALKKAKAACSANLAEATSGGEMPPAFGIFALKQHGWTDKQQIEHSGEIQSTIQLYIPAKKPE